METLEEEEQSTTAKISFPGEIIEDILSRLPSKSILRFRSVSKPWLSLIPDPSFTKLYFTRATVGHRIALYFSAFDNSTRKQYFLSAAHDGEPVTHLMTLDLTTLDNSYSYHISEAVAEGLVCLTCTGWISGNRHAHAFVFNPSTRKIFKIPYPTNFASGSENIFYLFGFDEARNEHKILLIRKVFKSKTIEFMIFSMSTHSWRKIDVELPIGFSWGHLYCDMDDDVIDGGVCVNSVVHVMLQNLLYDILAFDFVTEKLSIIRMPQGVVLDEVDTIYFRNGESFEKNDTPRIMKIDGCLTVVCHDRVVESNEIDIWMLQDYPNRVWVRETIKFPEPWVELRGPYPLPEDVNMEDEIIFSLSKSKASESVMIVPIYNKKSRCFKLSQFTLGHQFLCSETVEFNNIKCYVESIMPL